jgi:hypothetical protein
VEGVYALENGMYAFVYAISTTLTSPISSLCWLHGDFTLLLTSNQKNPTQKFKKFKLF